MNIDHRLNGKPNKSVEMAHKPTVYSWKDSRVIGPAHHQNYSYSML